MTIKGEKMRYVLIILLLFGTSCVNEVMVMEEIDFSYAYPSRKEAFSGMSEYKNGDQFFAFSLNYIKNNLLNQSTPVKTGDDYSMSTYPFKSVLIKGYVTKINTRVNFIPSFFIREIKNKYLYSTFYDSLEKRGYYFNAIHMDGSEKEMLEFLKGISQHSKDGFIILFKGDFVKYYYYDYGTSNIGTDYSLISLNEVVGYENKNYKKYLEMAKESNMVFF